MALLPLIILILYFSDNKAYLHLLLTIALYLILFLSLPLPILSPRRLQQLLRRFRKGLVRDGIILFSIILVAIPITLPVTILLPPRLLARLPKPHSPIHIQLLLHRPIQIVLWHLVAVAADLGTQQAGLD